MIKRSKIIEKYFTPTWLVKIEKNALIGPLINTYGRLLMKDKEASTLLNDYFASVFTKNVENLVNNPFSGSRVPEISLRNLFITEADVAKTIGEFKEHKSPGLDGITSTYAIKTKNLWAEPLSLLFNNSINNNEIPSDWKRLA